MNNIKLALRNLLKHRTNMLINLVGLTTAISSLLLIFFWIRGELSYDQFHQNVNYIYRIVDGNPADKESFAGSPAPLGGFLNEKFPDVISYTRFDMHSRIVIVNNHSYNESRVAEADTSFFNIFTFPLIRGTKSNVLQKNNSIVLSESTAARYFGTADPMGKTLILNDSTNYEVTGVFEDIPLNSHIHFDLMVRFDAGGNNQSWNAWNYFTYLLTTRNTNPEAFKEKSIQWAAKNDPEKLEILNEIYYQPITQIHFQYNRKNLESSTEKSNIRAAMLVAILILIIACINFANLSALQSIERAREIALRKIMGESDSRLRIWMIGEALFISVISLFLSVILVENLLPFFNKELDSHIVFHFSDPAFIYAATALVLITGFLSGTYPAFILSSYKCVDLFNNKFRLSGRMTVRTLLVISQFTISIILMICILMINRQMGYIRSKDLGMNPEHIINVRLQSESIIRHGKEIKQEMMKIPGVIQASANSYIPSQHNEHWGLNLNERSGDGINDYVGLWIILADKDYLKTMQIQIIEGEELITNFTSSEVPFILNESAAKLIKGTFVTGKEFEFQNHKGRIIGITRDFHFRSMHHQIEPTAIVLYDRCDQISLRINASNIKETIASVEKTWNRFSPDLKFDYYFLDNDFELLYRSETKTGKLLMMAGILSILLSSLGIFGIVTYSANRRSKEIGIRKVNGSTSVQIIALLSKDYTWWILISFVIACPIAFFIMQNWLRNFVYKTTPAWWIYALAGLLAFLIAQVTISWQSWRVANRNPVEALRDE